MPSPIRRGGPQMCDACGREFTPSPRAASAGLNWICPHCGHDNRSPGEFCRAGLAKIHNLTRQRNRQRRKGS